MAGLKSCTMMTNMFSTLCLNSVNSIKTFGEIEIKRENLLDCGISGIRQQLKRSGTFALKSHSPTSFTLLIETETSSVKRQSPSSFWGFYRPQMKLQESNVFRTVCLSTGDPS